MKKKILFVMPYFNCGGVETTLLSLLDKLDYQNYDIDLLLVNDTGAFLHKIPGKVQTQVLDIPKSEWGVFYGYKNACIRLFRQIKIFSLFKLLIGEKYKLSENRRENVEYFEQVKGKFFMYDKQYDLAVDYFGYASFTTFYVAEKVKAKKKISWVHSRFSTLDAQYLNKYYKKFDKIYAVSKDTKNDFLSCVEIEDNKVEIFYNLIDYEEIRQLANEKIEYILKKDSIILVTVGRLEKVKGIDMAVEVARILNENNFDFCWYVIGEGTERNNIQNLICKYNLSDKFILLGLKENPYPYMKNCDIYIQPSRYEGYCTTTNEARILARPVITTDVYGAKEQFANGENGLIVDIDYQCIANAVVYLIENPDIRKLFQSKLSTLNNNTVEQLKKIYRMCNS
ncbi:MAG: glycosyltransferase [Thomasclavelia sp.]|uniref:glycosyltransferase n=1 Tax=Thomasclavelia sp. TaxID=3025757 RepID=UPI0039A075DC